MNTDEKARLAENWLNKKYQTTKCENQYQFLK